MDKSIENLVKDLMDNHRRQYLNVRDSTLIKVVLESLRKTFPTAQVNRVTVNKNNRLDWHKHPNQGSVSYGLLFGDFKGGELVHSKGVECDKGKWFSFDGTEDHRVNDFIGDRYSVVAYDR